jgi:phosphoglycolate phosphatase
VHGRLSDATLLKPHPDCLLRALAATGTPPKRAVMLGDAVQDFEAATAAEVAFIGYAPSAERRRRLSGAGAEHVTGSLKEVLDAAGTRPFG